MNTPRNLCERALEHCISAIVLAAIAAGYGHSVARLLGL